MKPKLLVIGLFLAVASLISFGVTHSSAQTTTTLSGRSKVVHVQITNYVWQLLSLVDNHLICEVTVEHTGVPTTDELVTTCYSVLFPLAPTSTPGGTAAPATTPSPAVTVSPTAIPFDFAAILKSVYWHLKETLRVDRTLQIPLPDMGTNIMAPDKVVAKPYVIISAYEPVPEYHIVSLQGQLNYNEFICPEARCEVPLTGDSVIEFWATSSSGDESTHLQATIRVTQEDSGSRVAIVTSGPFPVFADACATAWGLPPSQTWAAFPRGPEQLATNVTLYYLASKLITTGIVNASSCPGSGFLSSGSPNACGIDAARAQLITWQNQFDPVIWAAGRDVGIPPRMIKALIQVETQFWPGNTRFFLVEYGFGQLTQQGADVALRWDPTLYQLVCSELLYDCTTAYEKLPAWEQATLAGGLLKLVNGDCPTCNAGIDILNAQNSVPILARTYLANCTQVKNIIGTPGIATSNYDDMWKFTLVSYHNGFGCLLDAVETSKKLNEPLDWAHVSTHFSCSDAISYVNEVWNALNVNTIGPYVPVPPDAPTIVPTFLPTATPTVTPTPFVSKAQLIVQVYIDYNRNNQPEPNEVVNGVEVLVSFSDGTSMRQTISNGAVIFNLSGKLVGLTGTISIPTLFLSGTFIVPASGEVSRMFNIAPPVLPTALP